MAKGTPVARLSVRVLPDTSEFGPKLRAQLAKVGNMKVNVDPDLSGFAAKIKAEAARVRDVKVGVDVDRSFGDRVGFAAERGISRNAGRIGDAMSGALAAGIGKAFAFSTGLVKFSAIGLGAATAAAGVGALLLKVVPLVGEVAQLAGLLPLIPAALGGLAGIAGTVMLGLNGIGDAFKNIGDPEKFAKSLEKLSPAAQSFVKAAKGIKDAFKGIQMDVQERLFSGLGDELKSWKTNLLPALASGFGDIATGLNGVAKNVMQAFGNAKVTDSIKTLFGNTGSALTTAGPGFASIITGFSVMSAAASKFFDRFAAAFTKGGAKFEAWVDKIVANGQLDQWINQGIDAFKNLAGIVRNVGSILASVFRVSGGGGMLEGFNALTERFARWAKSDAGQRVFDRMFTTADQIIGALSPIIPALAGLAASLNIGGIAQAVGPQIANIIDALKPAAKSLGQLLQDIATPLGNALTSFATYIGPAIDAITPGVKDLFGALQKIAPDLGSILVDVAGIGSDILSFVADALPGFVSAVKSITGKIADIVDSLGGFGPAIATAIAALALLGGGKGGKGGGLAGKAGWAGLILGLIDIKKGPSDNYDTIGEKQRQKELNIGSNYQMGKLYELDKKAWKDLLEEKLKIGSKYDTDTYEGARKYNLAIRNAQRQALLDQVSDQKKALKQQNDDRQKALDLIESNTRYKFGVTTAAAVQGSAEVGTAWANAARDTTASFTYTATQADAANQRITDSAVTNASATSGAWSRAAADSATFTDNSSSQMEGAWTRAGSSATWWAQTTQAQFTFASNSSAASADRASAAMSNAWSRAGSSAAGAANQADGAWRSAAANSGGAWQSFYNSFNTNRPAQASAASAQGALNAWSGVGSRAASLGAEFGNGLASGINSKLGSVQAAANNLAEVAIRAARTAAAIASPSKKMAEIGAYMSEGLAVGIASNVGMVRSAAQAASNAAIDSAAGNMAGVGLASATGPSTLQIYDVNNVLLGSMDVRSGQVVSRYDRQSEMTASYSRGV